MKGDGAGSFFAFLLYLPTSFKARKERERALIRTDALTGETRLFAYGKK